MTTLKSPKGTASREKTIALLKGALKKWRDKQKALDERNTSHSDAWCDAEKQAVKIEIRMSISMVGMSKEAFKKIRPLDPRRPREAQADRQGPGARPLPRGAQDEALGGEARLCGLWADCGRQDEGEEGKP